MEHWWTLDHIFPQKTAFHPVQEQQQKQQQRPERTDETKKQQDAEEAVEGETTDICCRRVAVLDLDGTLITTKSGKKFPVDSNDWKLLYAPQTQRKLQELVHAGYHLVILSNQLGVEKGYTTLFSLARKCESLQKMLDLPMTICLAVGDDLMRKPRPAAAVFIFDRLLPYLYQYRCCTQAQAVALPCCCGRISGTGHNTQQQHGEQEQQLTIPLKVRLPLHATGLPVAFFVGDAAGRLGSAVIGTRKSNNSRGKDKWQQGRATTTPGNPIAQGGAATAKDHGDADVKFALNIGLPFFTPEQFFLGIEGEAPPLLVPHTAGNSALPAAGDGSCAVADTATHPSPATSARSGAAYIADQATPYEGEGNTVGKRAGTSHSLFSTEGVSPSTKSDPMDTTRVIRSSHSKKLFSGDCDVLRGHTKVDAGVHSFCLASTHLSNKTGTRAAFDPRALLRITQDTELLAARKRLLWQKLRGTTVESNSVGLHTNSTHLSSVYETTVSPMKKRLNVDATIAHDSAAAPTQESKIAGMHPLAGITEQRSHAKSGSHVLTKNDGLIDSAMPTKEQEVVLLLGAPGSGKSTMACTFFKDYVSVCQDELRTQQKCIRACETALRAGNSVIIDMQNTRRQTRSIYITLAKQLGVEKVRCVALLWPKDFCKHTLLYRSLVARYRAYRRQVELKLRHAEVRDNQGENTKEAAKARRKPIITVDGTGQRYFASNVEDIRFRLERMPPMVVDSFYKHLEVPSADEGLTDTVVLDDLIKYFVPAHFANDEEEQLFFSFVN